MRAGQELLHYRLIEKIGQGGMGVVWRAEDTRLHRPVALKVLPEGAASDATRLSRFEREARSVAALNHPNIVTVYSVEEADTDDGSIRFITMELVEGSTLTQLLPGDGFPLKRLLEIALPLADAVSHAHRAGITHRDLKPDNIMVDGEGRLRILDFGLAKLTDASTQEGVAQLTTVTSDTEMGQLLGTLGYMSPEQAEGQAVDVRSDVFSLGTILYEMATGTRPFRGASRVSTLKAILVDDPVPISELNPALPPELERIVRRCLVKDPDRRYQSALELRNELEELKGEVVSGVTGLPRGVRAGPARSRTVLLPGLVALLVVLALGVAAVSRWAGRDDPGGGSFVSRPVIASVGWNDGPCWSPDGQFVAFARMEQGSFDIYVQNMAGGEAKLRVGGPGDQVAPRWTPDGKHLTYVSSEEPGTWVCMVPAYGGEPSNLIETGIGTLNMASQRRALGNRPWSRDGRTLLVSRVTESGRLALFRVDRSTREATQITFPPVGCDDLGASYSFDHEEIVFQRQELGMGSVLVLPAAGGEPEIVLQDEFDNERMVWRPDGRRIVFRSDRGGAGMNLFELDRSTGEVIRQLTFETKMVWGPTVSADDRLLYPAFWHDTFLYEVDAATGQYRELNRHRGNNFGARYSPDGTAVAYHSTRSGPCEIWLHHLDGRDETQITRHEGWDLYPDVSPDGSRVIFVSDRDGGEFKLFIQNLDGGSGARPLVDQSLSWQRGGFSPVNSFLASRWSPDGALIGYLVVDENGSALWTVSPAGEDPQKRLAGITGFDWYMRSSMVVVSRRCGSEDELVAVDLASGDERYLFKGALCELDVAPDGSAVAFCLGRGHLSMGLAILPLAPPGAADGLPEAAGEVSHLVRSEGTWHVHNAGWSPDSRKLVYTQDRDYGDIYELKEGRQP